MSSQPFPNNTGVIMLTAYREHVAERAAKGIPPKPLSPEQVT